MSWCESVWVHLIFRPSVLPIYIYFFLLTCEVLSHSSLNTCFNPLLSSSPSESPVTKCLYDWCYARNLLNYVPFFFCFLIGWYSLFSLLDHLCIILLSLSLLLIHSSMFSISIIAFFSFDWFFFVFSTSLLKFLLCSFFLFPNSVITLMLWLICLVNCLFLFHYLFFLGFSLPLSTQTSSSVFSFCLTFPVFMNLGERVSSCVLEVVSLCGCIPIQSECVQCLWWERWIWCEHKSCLSPGCAGSHHSDGRWGWRWRG